MAPRPDNFKHEISSLKLIDSSQKLLLAGSTSRQVSALAGRSGKMVNNGMVRR
jgi:hypothetical protein